MTNDVESSLSLCPDRSVGRAVPATRPEARWVQPTLRCGCQVEDEDRNLRPWAALGGTTA
jgi:hypothetical protein